ncbi:recombinase family protein [Ochrobactrum sp. Marseille-Q0166]|nr:recombinase family protein [Ochrobactrum sp. Marseille-Q0166]
MKVGYARVSTEEQKMDLQIHALKKIGCDEIFTDHGESGANFNRSGLEAAMAILKPGKTLVVWRLDRLGRSLSGLVYLMEQLGKRGVNFCSITENIDTASSGGKLMFHMMAALAEFERSLISERTREGIAAAKRRGVQVGRPKALSEDLMQRARCAIHCQRMELKTVARTLNVSERTIRRHMLVNETPRCAAICNEGSASIPQAVVYKLCSLCERR